MTNENRQSGNAGYPKWKFMFIGFALIAAFYLLTEHYAHVLGYLPYLLLLACPLMHLFGHGGHGRHEKHGEGSERNDGSAHNAEVEHRQQH